jgi:lysophospholipase L1-like esterase
MFWYEEEVKALEKKNKDIIYAPYTIFYGSSSVRLWSTLNEDFKNINPINLGFGGSTLAACVWFFNRIVGPYKPEQIVIYAGDNDIGDGKKPEEVFIFFQQLMANIEKYLGNIPCYFISIKPSISRWDLVENIKYTNNLIENEIIKQNKNWHFINIYTKMIDANGYPQKQYFANDGLHLSAQGYAVWKTTVQKALSQTEIKV